MPTLNYEEIGNVLFDGAKFILTNPSKLLSVTRLSKNYGYTYQIANRPLRILFMACSPENTPTLNFEYEERMILDSTKKFGIELVIEESGTLSGLKEIVELYGKDYFDIFHLTGHADIIDNKPCFLMEDEFGCVKYEDANNICRAFSSFWPKIIFLSGCKTALCENNISSLSHSLVCAGGPIVLGWADPVGDNVATKLSAFLYREIALGKKINEAIATSRALLYETEIKLKNYKKYWPLLRVYNNVTELSEIVTPFRTKGREKSVKREAISKFLDAGAQVEVCGARSFVGRRRNLQRCLHVLRSIEGDNSYAEGIVIFGMNGLGKTSMAARLCERMSEYTQFIFVGKIDEIEIIRSLSDKLSCNEVDEILSNNKLKFKNRLMLVFEKFINNNPSIFVFDNFEINLEVYNSDIKLKQEAYEIVNAILAAIHNSNSYSRVIITSCYAFEVMRPFKLQFECIESIRGTDLYKKLSYLDGIQNQNQEVIRKILKICDGNMKLLENINNILLDEDINENKFDDLLDEQINNYLYESDLYELAESLTEEQKKFLAIVSIFDIPISLNLLKQIIDYNVLELHLSNVIRFGLLEVRKNNNKDDIKYYISNYIKKLVEDKISDEERNKLIKKCVQCLYDVIWKNKHSSSIEELQELHRLSLISKDEEIVTEVGSYLSYFLNNDAQHEKAEKICLDTLSFYNNSSIYHNLAIAQNAMGNTQDAIKNYKLALNILDSNDDNNIDFNNEKANISINFAATNMFIGEVEKSKELIDDAEKIFVENEDLTGQAAVLNINGICDIKEGQVEKGLDKLQKAYELIRNTGDIYHLHEVINNIATVYANKGEFEEAFKLWKQILEYRTKTGDKRGEARIMNSIASTYAMQGNIDIALNMLEYVYSIQKSVGDLKGEANSLASKARIIKDMGNIDEALKMYSKAYDININIENLECQASNLDSMALIYLDIGQTEKAIELWEKAMAAYGKLNDICGQSNIMNNMAIEIKRKDQKKALEFFYKALSISRNAGKVREMAISQSNIALILEAQGDKTGALLMLKETLLFQESIKDIQGQAITKNNMAGIYEELNNEEEALTLWNESLTLHKKITT